VRAADDPISQGDSLDAGSVEERQDLGSDLWIHCGRRTAIAAGVLFGGDGDCYFRCRPVVRAIESDRCHRVSAKALPAEPFDGLSERFQPHITVGKPITRARPLFLVGRRSRGEASVPEPTST
jgi:hypothetical protein